MKTTFRFLFPAAGLLMLMTACTKEETTLSPENTVQTLVEVASDRCSCMTAMEMRTDYATGNAAKLSWYSMPEKTGFMVEFVQPGANGQRETKKFFTQGAALIVKGLQPETVYHFRVTTLCREFVSVPSKWVAFDSGEMVYGDPAPTTTTEPTVDINAMQ